MEIIENNHLEVVINVTEQELNIRKNICLNCDHFTAEHYEQKEITDAVTGNKEISNVFKYEDCDIDNISLTGFLTLKNSNCPLGKW